MAVNKLSELIDIRLANKGDIDLIMQYYRCHWNSRHILANDVNYLLYEHLDDDRLNFVIGVDKDSKDILAIIGFTDYGGHGLARHITSTMLSVSPKSKTPFLGIEMIRALKALTNAASYCGVTTNPATVAPYVKRFLKHKVGFFDHLYIANQKLSEYKILIEKSSSSKFDAQEFKAVFTEVYSFESMLYLKSIGVKQDNLPYKSLAYINRRYFTHPIFKYRYFIFESELLGTDSFIVAKIESVEEKTILRIVDFIGPLDMLNDLSYHLKNLIEIEGHEYCDLFCSNASIFLNENNCFLDRRLTNAVVPHYFYPYYQKNIDVLYETDEWSNVYFKGDGDGDRPTCRA